jgi:hypothetical protein
LIELWLPQDVFDITLVSKASLVRERKPLRIKSDSGDGRYKNRIRYPAGILDARHGENPQGISESKLSCLNYLLARLPAPWPRSAIFKTRLRGQNAGPEASWAANWAPPLLGKLLPSTKAAQRPV